MQHASSSSFLRLSLAASCLQRAQESVAPVFSRVNMAAKEQYSKALENERVSLMIHLSEAGHGVSAACVKYMSAVAQHQQLACACVSPSSLM